jgi:hypothetical protein
MRVIEEINSEELDDLKNYYPPREADINFKKIANDAVQKFLKEIPLWQEVHVHYGKTSPNALGTHIGETESRPIIVISPKNCLKALKIYRSRGIDLETIISTTIWHELGHSFYEYCAIYNLDVPEDEEKAAENIAWSIYYRGTVPINVKKLLKQIQKEENEIQ